MLGIYFSGTGNTKHCIEKLVNAIDENATILPLENEGVVDTIREQEMIVLGYPTQFSNAPMLVRDFIQSNDIWKDKKVLCVATMGAFSGDGAGCAARLLKKKGAVILGGLHIRMPDSVCDSKLLKKPIDENRKNIFEADKKLERAAHEIKNGTYPQEGITFLSHIVGLFGQRLWFYRKTSRYSKNLNINNDCNGCGLCVKICPMNNLLLQDKRAVSQDRCTMCYRCISQCPQKAITLLGKQVQEQCRFENYVP